MAQITASMMEIFVFCIHLQDNRFCWLLFSHWLRIICSCASFLSHFFHFSSLHENCFFFSLRRRFNSFLLKVFFPTSFKMAKVKSTENRDLSKSLRNLNLACICLTTISILFFLMSHQEKISSLLSFPFAANDFFFSFAWSDSKLCIYLIFVRRFDKSHRYNGSTDIFIRIHIFFSHGQNVIDYIRANKSTNFNKKCWVRLLENAKKAHQKKTNAQGMRIFECLKTSKALKGGKKRKIIENSRCVFEARR